MNGARDTVLQLEVHLGDGVLGEDGGIRDITDGSRLDHVADSEALDGLILGRASRAVAAADGLGVAAALLVATAVEENTLVGRFSHGGGNAGKAAPVESRLEVTAAETTRRRWDR